MAEDLSTESLSIVIPVLNDATCLTTLLHQVKGFKGEVIVVDGGSTDDSIRVAESKDAIVLHSSAGRARQMNLGAEHSRGETVLFLHADSVMPEDFPQVIASALETADWGRFDVRLSGSAAMLRLVEFMMNARSALTGICTGDQGIFVKTKVFKEIGGFPEIPLMEDIAFSKGMPSRPYRVRERLIASSRRWEKNGIFKTIWLMWSLRWRFHFGADPRDLAREYGMSR